MNAVPRTGISPLASLGTDAKSGTNSTTGLTSSDAVSRLHQFGPNSIPEASAHLIRSALGKFWAPVPWLLEAVIVLEVGLRNYVEASVIAVLLVFNAALSFFQESHAQATLAALKSRLALSASERQQTEA